MDTFKKILYKCLSYLGCDFNTFQSIKSERIKAQKYSYILQTVFNLPAGRFSLYLNGPYSSNLADDLYDIARNQNAYQANMEEKPLKEEVSDLLNEIRSIFNAEELGIDEVDLLEIYTTYDYLKENFSSSSQEEILSELKRRKADLFSHYQDSAFLNDLRNLDRIRDSIKALTLQ